MEEGKKIRGGMGKTRVGAITGDGEGTEEVKVGGTASAPREVTSNFSAAAVAPTTEGLASTRRLH